MICSCRSKQQAGGSREKDPDRSEHCSFARFEYRGRTLSSETGSRCIALGHGGISRFARKCLDGGRQPYRSQCGSRGRDSKRFLPLWLRFTRRSPGNGGNRLFRRTAPPGRIFGGHSIMVVQTGKSFVLRIPVSPLNRLEDFSFAMLLTVQILHFASMMGF